MSSKRKNRIRFCVSVVILCAMLCTVAFAAEDPAGFTDISGHWAQSSIEQAYQRQLVKGYNGLYRPDDSMSRAEMVTILWRAMGEPAPSGKASFTDLTQDWYRDAVAWAEENKIVTGVAPGKFGPDGNVTREQLATILFRLSGGMSGLEMLFTSTYNNYFEDEEMVADYAKAAIYWCYFNYVYCGTESAEVGSMLSPKADATRGQIAVMIISYLDRN